MFTQCSKCETVFRLSAEVLRAAGGQVRCGRCGEVFNALARLAEDGKGFLQGESPLDLETRADEILQSVAPIAAPIAPVEAVVPKRSEESIPHGVEIAQLQIIDPLFDDNDPNAESSLEFTLPPGELDRIFVATKTQKPLRIISPPASSATTSSKSTSKPTAAPVPVPAAVPVAAPVPALDKPAAPKPVAVAEATPKVVSGLEISDKVRNDMLSSFEHAELPEINKPRREMPRIAWLTAAFILGAVFLAQILRDNHEWLALHTPFASAAPSGANLSSYALRQWGVTGEPGAKGTLRVRATLLNSSAQLQPYPLLRVTLANRFGTRVGAREFEPAEYLGKPTARMLAPNEAVDATVDLLDPGKDAEGFEIDVCLRQVDRKIACLGDPANPPK